MLDFKINRIIGEAYEKILTGGGYLLESSDKRSLILKELQARPEEIMKIYNYIFKTLSKPQIASIYQKVFGTPMKSGDNVAKIYEELGMNSNGVNFLLNYVEPKTIDYISGMLGVDPRAANNHEQSTLQGQANNSLVDEIIGKIKNLKLKNESLRSLYLKVLRNVSDKNSLYTAARKLYNKKEEYYDISAVLVKAMLDQRGTFVVRDFANILRYLNEADLQKANTIVDQYIQNKQGGYDKQPNSTENTGDNTNAIQPTNDTQTSNNGQTVQITDEVVRNAMQSVGVKAINPDSIKLYSKIMNRIASRPKNTSYQEQLNYISNYYKRRKLPNLADKVAKVANHIFLKNNTQGQTPNSGNNTNTAQGQQPVQSDSTPYTIDILDLNSDSSIKSLAEKFGIYDDDWDQADLKLRHLFGDVAKMGYPAARKKFMEEWGDNDVIKVADYIDQNKAQYLQNYAEKKRKLDAFRNTYKQSMQKQHDAVMKYQQSLNKNQQMNTRPSPPPTNKQPSQPPTNNRPNKPQNKNNSYYGSSFIVDDDII